MAQDIQTVMRLMTALSYLAPSGMTGLFVPKNKASAPSLGSRQVSIASRWRSFIHKVPKPLYQSSAQAHPGLMFAAHKARSPITRRTRCPIRLQL
jgi:hypothetical protein